MPEIEPTAQLNTGFSQPDAAAPPWAEVVDVLSTSEMFWFSTVRRDGRPHVTPLPAIWLDGAFRDPDGRRGLVFGVTPSKVLAFGKGSFSQTRYRFTV